MDIRTTRMPATSCPSCGYPLDAASDIQGDATPSPGDLSMCIRCTSFLTFKDDLTLRLMTLEEIAELPDDTRNLLTRMRSRAPKIAPRSGGEDS